MFQNPLIPEYYYTFITAPQSLESKKIDVCRRNIKIFFIFCELLLYSETTKTNLFQKHALPIQWRRVFNCNKFGNFSFRSKTANPSF